MDHDDGRPDGSLVNRITTRAWRDTEYCDLLFQDAESAIRLEFGEIPDELRGVRFQPRIVDRVRTRSSEGRRKLLVRPKLGDEPLSVVTRQVLGTTELIIVFYTRRCRYQCSFCALPSTSAIGDVSTSDISEQIDHAFRTVADPASVAQVSLGNEGSLLDTRTFAFEQLVMTLDRVIREFPNLEHIVLETRAEFVTAELLDDLLTQIHPVELCLKIGLESADDHVREDILRKRMDMGRFEEVVALLGQKGVGLSTYVIVKADPHHDDEAGKRDAIQTCRYLTTLCGRTGTSLTLKINTMYRAAGTLWADWAESAGWTPPSIFDLADVLLVAAKDDVRVFAGLSEEGLATADGHYEVRGDFARWAQQELEEFNRTGDLARVRNVAGGRHR